jgi:hypothetical protein
MANKYKVNKRRWKKWSPLARKVFNETYFLISRNQSVFLHPKVAEVPKRQWKTTAWNAAWIAADAVQDNQ